MEVWAIEPMIAVLKLELELAKAAYAGTMDAASDLCDIQL